MPKPEEKPKRKRQRITFTCLYCKNRKIRCDKAKPKCANCTRLGRVCEYEKPIWVNTSVEQDLVKTNVVLEKGYASKTREELYQEIKYWKSLANGGSGAGTGTGTEVSEGGSGDVDGGSGEQSDGGNGKFGPSSTSSIDHQELEGHGEEIIDFYGTSDTLALKHSSHEEYKPLSTMTIYRVDPYLSFFLCFRFITLQVTSDSLSNKIKQNWKSRHPGGESKWLFLLDIKKSDAGLRNSIQKIKHDRVQLFGTNIFPFMTMRSSDDENVQFLINLIKEVLPTKIDMDTLLIFFFRFMWVLRPYVDQKDFTRDVKRIIVFDSNGENPEIFLEERHDFAIIATLLIILRHASIAISVTDDKYLSVFMIPLKNRMVSVRAINIAQLCLSMYKVIKKTTLEIVQAILFLRLYFREAPEDGDGLTMGQSQILFGSLVQSALAMGLNRDPTYFATSERINIVNLKRRIWYGIASLDIETSILSGSLTVLPSSIMFDVRLPYQDGVDNGVDEAISEEIQKEMGLHEIYQDIVTVVNCMKTKATLSEIIFLLDKARNYLEETYSLAAMVPTSKVPEDSEEYRINSLKNHKILEKNLIHVSYEINIYHLIFAHYEDNKNSNFNLFKKFFKIYLKRLTNAFDIADAYLLGALVNYNNPAQSNFALLPVISTFSYRSANGVASGLLRIFNAQDLLGSRFTGLKNADDNSIPKDFEKLIDSLCNIYENHLEIYERVVGAKYHISLKVICSCKFSYYSLKKHRFSILNNIIDFMEYNETATSHEATGDDILSSNTKRREQIRKLLNNNTDLYLIYTQWIQMAKVNGPLQAVDSQGTKEEVLIRAPVCNPITNINHHNHFIDLSQSDIDDFAGILGDGFKYCSIPVKEGQSKNGEKFTSNYSSAEDQLGMFYEMLSKDKMFNAQVSNILHQDETSNVEGAQLNSDLINEILGTMGPMETMFDVSSQYNDLFFGV